MIYLNHRYTHIVLYQHESYFYYTCIMLNIEQYVVCKEVTTKCLSLIIYSIFDCKVSMASRCNSNNFSCAAALI